MWVQVSGGGLSSRTEAAVLNGANVAFVETEVGWEMIQYQQAELVDVDTYLLSGLSRGQQGSDGAMHAGAAAGARVVFLRGAERRLDVADWQRGLEWRVSRESSIGGGALMGSHLHQSVAGLPWSPCHMTATQSGGDVALRVGSPGQKGWRPLGRRRAYERIDRGVSGPDIWRNRAQGMGCNGRLGRICRRRSGYGLSGRRDGAG